MLADGAVEGVLPENCRVRTFRAPHKALRGARFEAALTRELTRASRWRRRRAHVPDLRRSRRAARPAARHSARPVVHALAREPAAASRRAGVDRGDERRLALVSRSVEEAPRDRPRDRPRRVSVLATAARARDCACSRSAATRPRRGSTSSSRQFRSPATTSSCTSTARRSRTTSGRIAPSSSSSSRSWGSRDA